MEWARRKELILSSVTDSVVLALTLYFLYRGWSRGLLRTLAGPVALIAGCLGAFIYYAQTHNIIVAFIISIVAPLILNIFFSVALAVWRKMTKTENPISPASRALGAGLCVLWGGINILLIIVLIAVIPLNTFWIERTRRDIFNSVTYSLIAKHLVPGKSIDIRSVSQALQDPEQMRNLQSSAEYQAVWEDKTLQKLMADEEIMRDIRDKNFAKLLANPKMQAMMKDPALVKKILDMNIKIMEQNTRPADARE